MDAHDYAFDLGRRDATSADNPPSPQPYPDAVLGPLYPEAVLEDLLDSYRAGWQAGEEEGGIASLDDAE
jgi:hypothetical protein